MSLAATIRKTVLDQSKRANVGHIGSSLSVADILAGLYGGALRLDGPRGDHDRLVMSKGHAALALYSALEATGRLEPGQIDTYCCDGTVLGVHPEAELDGVDFCTGSLGHGLSLGTGAALAGRLQKSLRRCFVVMSDAELNEGSVWEAVMVAAHHKLANLIAILDLNGQQALGYTRDVIDLAPVADRFRAFGWNVHEIDGHDPDGLISTIEQLDTVNGPPHMLVADTTFGKGVSYMESKIAWHYMPMNDDQYAQAIAEVGAPE